MVKGTSKEKAKVSVPQADVMHIVGGQSQEHNVPEFSFPQAEGQPQTSLSELEWRIIKFLWDLKHPVHAEEVAESLHIGEVKAAFDRLVVAGLVELKDGRYRITSKSRMNIPLFPEEREALLAAEARIDSLVCDIQGKQLDVAKELRVIRDGRLYRETHKRFQDYVEERFTRTRDWAYKAIQELEVRENLKGGKDVDALLQTVTVREVPVLAKLKSEPAKLQKALRVAEDAAKTENRPRTLQDVQKAVASFKPPKKEEAAPSPKAVRKIVVTGIEFEGGETDDLPGYFTKFARWLKDHPPTKAFTVNVGKPKKSAVGEEEAPPVSLN